MIEFVIFQKYMNKNKKPCMNGNVDCRKWYESLKAKIAL